MPPTITKPTTNPQVEQAMRANPKDEIGQTGSNIFWGQVQEAYLPELRYPSAASKYSEMLRRDPTIASLDVMIKLLAGTASWSVEAGGNTEADNQARDLIDSAKNDMSHTFEESIEDALSCVFFGFHYAEIVYKRRQGKQPEGGAIPSSQYDDQAIGWRKWAPRKQSTLSKWEFDENGGTRGMWQILPYSLTNSGTVFIPINKSLLFNARRDPGNPEGLSFLEPVYEAWHYVKNLAIIQGIGFERSFTGLPVFAYLQTPTTEDKTLVEQTAKALRVGSKAYVSYPKDKMEFAFESTQNSNAAPLLESIKYYRTLILQTLLAQFLSLGNNGVGSFALGQDQSLLFLMVVDSLLDKIADVLNRFAIPRLLSYADLGQLTAYPQFAHTTVQKPNLPQIQSYLVGLSSYLQPFLSANPDKALEIANYLLEQAHLPTMENESETSPETGTEDEAELAKMRREFRLATRRFNEAMSEKAG